MEAKAHAKTVRITPRKARLVIDLIKGKNIKEARAILMFTPKAASPIITKVLNSAVANATHNLSLNEDSLFFMTSVLFNQPFNEISYSTFAAIMFSHIIC